MRKKIAAGIGIVMVLTLVGFSSTAVAKRLIGSADVRDNSLKTVDIKNGTLTASDMSPATRQAFNKPGPQGKQGPRGLTGATGPQGPAGPAGGSNVTQVTDLDGEWTVRASDADGATLTGDGVQFGPFANDGACATAGADYARLDFSGMNGQPLSALLGLSYSAQHVADTDTQGYGAIPIRVFFDDPETEADDRLTFSPNTQFNTPANYGVDQGTVNEYLVTSGTARVNDDAGNNPSGERPVAEIIEEFGDLEITNINFLGGCSGAGTTNLRQIVTEVEINGQTYAFGVN